MSCKNCQKTCLSFLPLRPSPVAKDAQLAWHGTSKMPAHAAAKAVSQGIEPKHSHLVTRLLRWGYLHIYMPKAPTGKQWRVYHIDNEANLRLLGDGLAQAPAAGTPIPPCTTAGHDAYGQKLATIPDARAMGTVWLAYSANLWNAKLREQNKANPLAMVPFKPMEGGSNTFKPTQKALQDSVLECAVPALSLGLDGKPQNIEPNYPFASLVGLGHGQHHDGASFDRVQRLAKALQKAAASSPKTAGKELAVVLPDPVGLTAELNDLRVLAERCAMQLTAKDEHKLQSHFVLQGLANNVADLRAFNNVAPIVSRSSFMALQKSNPTQMQGATFESLSTGTAAGAQEEGRMWTPKARATFVQQAPKFQALAKQEIESGYDLKASEAWVNALNDKTLQAIAPYESQWLAARNHSSTAQYFSLHFDAAEPNKPSVLPRHCAGSTYVQESSHADGPPPKTSVELLNAYMALYDKNPEDPHAYAVRAMVANQQELLKPLSKALSGDPNMEAEEGGGMRDKTVDFMKGLLELNNGHLKIKYSWLTDATMTLAMGPMNHLTAAMGTYVALAGSDKLKTQPKLAKLALNAAAWFGGMNTALKSAMTRQTIHPVMVQAWVDSDLVDGSVQGVGKQRKSGKHQRGGKTRVTLLTDTERLAKQPTVAQLLAESGATQRAFGKAAGAAMAAGASSGTIVLQATDARSAHASNLLFAQQVQEAKKVAGSVRAAIPTGAKAVAMGIDGRLALASVIVQSIGIINGNKAIAKAEKELQGASAAEREDKAKALRDAELGLMDSWGGLVSGSLDTLRVAGEAMNLQRGAAAGGAALGSIHALKFGAQVAGVFGGFLNGYVSYLKADEADAKGLRVISNLHYVATLSFGGTGITSILGAGLVGAEFIVERQIGNVALQATAKGLTQKKVGEMFAGRAATFVGPRMAGIAIAAAIPVAGWGLLGVGIVASVGAALMEPTKLEQWARKTPFGKGPEGAKFKTVEEQNKALTEALGLAQTVEPEAQAV